MDTSFLHKIKERGIVLGKKAWRYLRSQPPLKLLFLLAGIPGLFLILFFTFLFVRTMNGGYGHMPDKQELALIENSEASSVISEDGQLIGKYFRENRISVPLGEISPYVTEALIATEDSRFFEHSGIDVWALGRVAVKTKILGDRRSGGGSTISQQLAKQLYPRVAGQDMLKTKLREMIIASRLEEVYDKQELLALYLNTVPFGELAFGIEVAANRFFSKSAKDLRAEEAAVLVGLLKSTRDYNPRNYPEASTGRRNVVLSLMAKNGVLSQEKVDSLSALPLEIRYRRENNKVGSAPHFRRMLRQEVERALAGKTHPDKRPYDIDRDGLRIHVSINSTLQRLAEEAVLETMPDVQAALATDWRGRSRAPWEDAFLKTVKRSPRYQQYAAAGKSEEEIMEPNKTTIPNQNNARSKSE